MASPIANAELTLPPVVTNAIIGTVTAAIIMAAIALVAEITLRRKTK